MQRVRLTLAALLPVLLVAFLFVACQEDSPTTPKSEDITPEGENDRLVEQLVLTVGTNDLTDYYGRSDSVAVTATARRADGTAVANANIVITVASGPGKIVYAAGNSTDPNGQVRAKFVYTMLQDDSSTVRATVNKIGKNQGIRQRVRDIRVHMTATPPSQEVVTGEAGQATLKIRVQDELGVVVQGVPIRMQMISGAGSLTEPKYDPAQNAYLSSLTVDAVNDIVQSTIRAFVDPTAPIVYTSGSGNNKMTLDDDDAGEEELPVIQSTGKGGRRIAESVTTDTIVVNMTPSNSRVSSIFVNAEPNRMVVAPGLSEQSVVTLVAYDENNNGVPQLLLHLRVRNVEDGGVAGSISTPPLTDDTGTTTATLSTNLRYGTWRIEASAGPSFTTVYSTTVDVVTGSTQQIQVVADTSRIAVAGTNGIETTQVRANVSDQNGNSVQDGTKVFFLLTQFPWEEGDEGRVRIGNSNGLGSPYVDPAHQESIYGLPFDSTVTNSGEAVLTLRSGTRKGPLRMRAWSYLNEERTDSVSASYSGMAIVAGPPEYVEIDYNSVGTDGGGAVWLLEISARVQDIANNDVADGYQVTFTVEPENTHIADGFTGNIGPISAGLQPGVAFTGLRYHSRETNQPITVFASVIRGSDGLLVTDSNLFTLPIQQAVGVMSVTPSNFHFSVHPNQGYAVFQVTIHVYDGHQHLINDQVIHYSPQVGRMYDTNILLPQNPQRAFAVTGSADYGTETPDGDPEGVCRRWLLITQIEAFPDPASPQATCTINAEMLGIEDSHIEPQTVFLYQSAQ